MIITNLALWCSPEQVEFYLVDFKKGVEFKCYAAKRLPHARVVAIESDREFGLSVLAARSTRNCAAAATCSASSARRTSRATSAPAAHEPMPRTLLMIDEFQEFFIEDDRVAQDAALLLDRIVRQGRAFGIHVMLGSQTLGGAYTLARATLGPDGRPHRAPVQRGRRLPHHGRGQPRAAPALASGRRHLQRRAGALEGNSPFQIVWLPDDVRDQCSTRSHALRRRRAAKHAAGADRLRRQRPGRRARERGARRSCCRAQPTARPPPRRVWLGAPNSIKGPTEAVFRRQSGNNLLVVGQRDETALALLSVTLVSFAAQHPPGTVRFVLLDSTAPGTPAHEFLERSPRSSRTRWTGGRRAGGNDGRLVADLAARRRKPMPRPAHVPPDPRLAELQEAPPGRRVQLRHGRRGVREPGRAVDHAVKRRAEPGPARDGDMRYVQQRRAVPGPEGAGRVRLRVLFQMSASDSASLMDDPAAGALGMHRALFYHEQEGTRRHSAPTPCRATTGWRKFPGQSTSLCVAEPERGKSGGRHIALDTPAPPPPVFARAAGP